MDGYLENAMDYVLETFESANEWMKENDFLKFPMVEANFNAYIHPNGGGVTVFLNPGTQSGPSFAPSFGQNNNPASSSSMGGGGGSSNLFSSFGGNSFGSGDKFGASTSGASEPKWEPYPLIDLSKPQVLTEVNFYMFDKMGNMGPQVIQNTNTGSGSGGGGTSEQGTNTGDNAQNCGNSGETSAEKEEKEWKECIKVAQIFAFANAAYYKEALPKQNERGNPNVVETYEDKILGSKAAMIFQPIGAYGFDTFNIAGTADPMEEGIENFMRDSINDVLIGTNSLQGILKDRINWYISRIEEYNKVVGENEPIILNGHSSGGFEALIIAALRPDLVSQVNMVDSPGGYDIILKLMNGDIAKVNEVYKKVEIYNGNRNFVNSKGSHPPGKVIHHIPVDVHAIKEFARVLKASGSTEILGRCHTDNLCNYKNGEYTVERFKDDVTKKEIADYFGLSEGQIEAIDNKALSAEDLAKFENKISSKFKFKVAHERSQEEQCVY